MKKFIATLVFCLAATAAYADTTKQEVKTKDGVITVETDTEKDYMTVKTRNNVIYRIYPCGKLEKQSWSVLNQNEDQPEIRTLSGSYVISNGNYIRY